MLPIEDMNYDDVDTKLEDLPNDELDALAAERVMKWKRCLLWCGMGFDMGNGRIRRGRFSPTTDANDRDEMLEAWREQDPNERYWSIESARDRLDSFNGYKAILGVIGQDGEAEEIQPTPNRAATIACIRAAGGE